MPLLQVFVSAAVALLVVGLGHAFALDRDRKNRRQEQRIDYLISVYRAFSKANHHPRLYEVAEELEQAIADVQLFGTKRQVELVRRFSIDLAKAQTAEMDDLLMELRDSLRSELNVERLDGRLLSLRVSRKKDELVENWNDVLDISE